MLEISAGERDIAPDGLGTKGRDRELQKDNFKHALFQP